MRRGTTRILIAPLLLISCSAAGAQTDEDWERYFKVPRGPYRGRVLDAETQQPLAGAVVVAAWRRDRVYPSHLVSEHYAARETVTNANGEFALNADDVERGAPRRTLRPTFTIFLPGYGSFPRFQSAPKGFIGGIFEGAGATVELPRIKTHDERLRHLRSVDPYDFSETPFTEIPEFTRLFNQERVSLGLGPYPSSRR